MSGGPSPAQRLLRTARHRSFPVGRVPVLTAYLRAVLEANRSVNLTAAKTLDEAVDVLALSALSVTRAWDGEPGPRRIADLGTGNGLPGVAAALAWPDAKVLLVERRSRKAEAVRRCITSVGIGNAEVATCDARELVRERPEVEGDVDLVTIRAVGTLAEGVRLAAGWLAPGGRIAHWKGARLGLEEILAGARAARARGIAALETRRFSDAAGPANLVLYERGR